MTRAMKDSGIEWIGQIPENWNITKIGWNSKFINGYAFKGENLDIEKEVPVIRIGDIQQGTIDYSNCLKYDQNENLDAYRLKNKDIVIAMSGATTGKTAYLKEAPLAYINQRVGIVRGCSKYCYYCFQVDGFFQYISLLSAGSAQPNISMGQIQGFKIPFISDKEQQKIADYLDKRCEKIDTAIDNQKQIIEKLKEYKQSLITETVTKGLNPNVKLKDSGIEWIGSIPEHWQDIKLKFNSYIRARLGWKGLKAEEYVEQGYPLLSAFNIINNKLVFEDLKFINQMRYDESPEIKLQKDDILLVKDGAGIGKCALVTNLPFPSTVNGSIAVVTTNKNLTSKFLYYYFLSKLFQAYIERLKDGMGVPHLFQSDLKEICIVSPNKLEQKEITEYLDKKCNQIDEAIKQKEETINKLEEYKKSLIFECVTGKKEVA